MLKKHIKNLLHRHCLSDQQNVVVFSSPRGGSTWITELIASLPGFWPIHEPFNVRTEFTQRALGINNFCDLYAEVNQEVVLNYYRKLLHGEFCDLKLRPGNRFYRPNTSRIVVKHNQALLNAMNWFTDSLSIRPIHLLRHPIAVALSREVFPLLMTFGKCELRDLFSENQLKFADRIITRESHNECGVLAWCLHHAPALWSHRSDTLLLSYEHLVMHPDETTSNLGRFLGAEKNIAEIRQNVNRPSGVLGKSDSQTQKMMLAPRNPEAIVSKWRGRVSADQELRLLEILEVFDIDIYHPGEALPRAWKGHNLKGD